MGSDERLKIFMAQMRLLLLVPIGYYGSGYRLQSEGVAPVTLCTFLCFSCSDTGRLTDLSAVFTYVASGLNCDGDVKGLIVVSDYIVTLNHATLSKSLQNLHDLRYKVGITVI